MDPFKPVTASYSSFPGLSSPVAPAPAPAPTGPATPATIGEIQGDGPRSPLEGKRVVTTGVVTAVRRTGFYMQAAKAEAAAGSRGVWVFTADAPQVGLGDRVQVTGQVVEFKNNKHPNDLSVTELDGKGAVIVQEKALNLDAILGPARAVGKGGLVPPNVKATEGIKFYEALEGERVTFKDLLVVGATNGGTFSVVTDGGALATTMTSRGTLIKSTDDDAQPEAVNIRFADGMTPPMNVGDRISGQLSGIMTYQRGRYILEVDALPTVTKAEIPKFKLDLQATATQMLCASINCENLDAKDPPERFTRLGTKIVDEYGAPDVIGLQEIQDNDGATNDGETSASETGRLLCEAIVKAGGPSYVYIDRAPQNNQDGGEPGGNIRCAMLVRTDRVDVDQANIKRLGEGDPAFAETRKPLVVPLTFKATGKKINAIVVHNSSKYGTEGLWGEHQPPQDPTEVKRQAQLGVIHKFILENGGIAFGDFNQEPRESINHTPLSIRSRVQFVSNDQPIDAPRSYIFDSSAQNIDQIQTTIDMRVKLQVDATNAMLADGDPRRDSDHGHLIFTVDMAQPKMSKLRARLLGSASQLAY